MWRMKLLAVSILIVLSACSGENQADADDASNPSGVELSDVVLCVSDTIGVLAGDGNYVFGDIGDATILPSGDVAILDRMTNRVLMFTPQGDFITSLGGHGDAPWEFSWAGDFAAMINGWMIVTDYAGGKLVVFDDTLGYHSTITGFDRTPPTRLEPLPDNTFIGRGTEMWQDEDGRLQGENFIARWNLDSPQPITTYFSSPMHITLLDDGIDARPAAILGTTSIDGSVYCTVSSDSLYQIFAYDTNGNPTFQIEEPWERVAKTQEEMDEEGTAKAIQTDEEGVRTPVTVEVEVDPYHYAVSGLTTDDSGRLWVRIGSERIPTFRIYDHTGEYLYTATCPDLEEYGRQIRFQAANGGIIAWDFSPEDYPKVYLIRYEE